MYIAWSRQKIAPCFVAKLTLKVYHKTENMDMCITKESPSIGCKVDLKFIVYRNIDVYIALTFIRYRKHCCRYITCSRQKIAPCFGCKVDFKVYHKTENMDMCTTKKNAQYFAAKLTEKKWTGMYITYQYFDYKVDINIYRKMNICTSQGQDKEQPIILVAKLTFRLIATQKTWTCIPHGNHPIFWLQC